MLHSVRHTYADRVNALPHSLVLGCQVVRWSKLHITGAGMQGCQSAHICVHANSKRCTCSTRITSSVTVLLYKEKEYKQVYKIFSKNVEGCRDGSAKNHMNYIWWWQCPGKTGYTRTTQVTPSLHLFSSATLPSHLIP